MDAGIGHSFPRMKLVFILMNIFVASNLIINRGKKIASDGMIHCSHDGAVLLKTMSRMSLISVEAESSF